MGNPTRTNAWAQLDNLQSVYEFKSRERVIGVETIRMDMTHSGLIDSVFDGLIDLAVEQDVSGWRSKMFDGVKINNTENRAVLHTALRDGRNIDAQEVLNKIKTFVEKTHKNSDLTDVVHVGIGGSDLGPRFVCGALSHLPKQMNVHFVSNVDGAHIAQTLAPLNPQTTLIVIASKTFTTQETMMNAAYAKQWLGDLPVADHMIALSTNKAAVADFGIDTNNMFPFWDWVGGRFSVWSAIGMPIALAYGFDVFQSFLDGGCTMDNHFKTAENHENLPVLLALNGIWNRNFMDRPAYAVLPYSQNLNDWCDYLQQVDMESNGKSVDRDGAFITDYKTGPIVFGQAGTNGQHAFHQWMHQGTDIVHSEFITIKNPDYDAEHARVLNAHATAQADAFSNGRVNANEPHRHYEGARPSLTLELDDLSPQSIGQLMALYEHKIFVQGVVWNINSFDQWGVELGKDMAQSILES
jgi:glucose-6-phosphate isomerase